MPALIAIDFGTSRTKLAYLDARNQPRVKFWEDEKPFVPSLFYLERDGERVLWGFDAEQMQDEDPAGLVEALKRKLLDRHVRANRRLMPPVELLARLFRGLWDSAREEVPALRDREQAALRLTVPVYFGPAAVAVLTKAAKAAGFTEVEPVQEPVAAARAWLAEAGQTGSEVVVLDCGGGTLDWAYLRYESGVFRPVVDCPPGGDVHVGGYDVDLELAQLARERYADLAGEEPEVLPLHKLRVLKERYCKGLPLKPLRIAGREVALGEEEIRAALQERYIRQACDSLRSYLDRIRLAHPKTRPPVLLVGGSARIKGLQEALESECGCEALWWERSEYATVLGALTEAKAEPTPAPKPAPAPDPQPVVQPALPPVEDIHGWPAERVQDLQRRTAEALGKPVVFRDALKSGGEGPEMVVIPAGKFLMGSPANEPGRSDDEGPQHQAIFAKPFAMGKYAVTFDDYDRYCRATGKALPGAESWGRGRRPVINVSWEQARTYCAWLSGETGKRYRLPSEAEWECACRAGTTTPFWWGATITPEQANYDGNNAYNGEAKGVYRKMTVPVEEFLPNPFGLYQMHGNVCEWLEDIWHQSYQGAPGDGSVWIQGGEPNRRCVRGGEWDDGPMFMRSAFRFWYLPSSRNSTLGFRLAQD
jgi:formylglycine-generating enzyme required for sulfatase activity